MYIHICIYCYIYSLPAGHLAEWAAGKTSLRGNKNPASASHSGLPGSGPSRSKCGDTWIKASWISLPRKLHKKKNVVTDSTMVQILFPSGKLTVCH